MHQHADVLPGVPAQTGTNGVLHVHRERREHPQRHIVPLAYQAPVLEFPAELEHTTTLLERESVCKVGKEPPKKRVSASSAAAGSAAACSAAASSAVTNAVAATGAAVDESRDDEGAIAVMIEGT
jgi:hypothetical protein